MSRVLPRLEIVRRLRPVDLVQPGSVGVERSSAGTVPMAAVAPYVAATTSGTDGPIALHLGDAPPRRRDRRRIGVARRHGERDAAQSPLPPCRPAHGAGGEPDRHPRHGVEPGGRRLGRPGPARPARRASTPAPSPTLAGLRVELPAAGGIAGGFGQLGLRDVRFVTEADGSPLRTDERPLADRDVRRTRLLRHRPHQRVAARPLDPGPLPRRRPVLPPARPTGRLRRPRHPPGARTPAAGWWRPARGATSSSRPRAPGVVRRQGCG